MNITFYEVLTLAIGVLFTITAIFKRKERIKLLASGIKVKGKVVKIEEVPSSDNSGSTYEPTIQFTTLDKHIITKATGFSTSPCPYKVGEKVTVFYDPEKAEHFTLNDRASVFVEIIIFGLGVLALLATAIMFIIL